MMATRSWSCGSIGWRARPAICSTSCMRSATSVRRSSLHDCWADTTTPHGRLMLTILGSLAEFERSLIKARTDVGIKRAREQGIRFGRPPKLTKH